MSTSAICIDKGANKSAENLKLNPPYSISFKGRTWSVNDGLRIALSSTAKVAGALFLMLSFSALPCVFICMEETDLFLATLAVTLGVINKDSEISWNRLDLRITNSWLLGLSQICSLTITYPIIKLRELLGSYTPSIEYDGVKTSKLFIGTAIEDIVSIGLIQRTVLPVFAKLLPKRYGSIVSHKIARVVISSAIFALSHERITRGSPCGILPQFIAGLVLGTMAEREDSLLIPIVTHFAYDLIVGAGNNLDRI